MTHFVRIAVVSMSLAAFALGPGAPAKAEEMAAEMAAAVNRAVKQMIQPAYQAFAERASSNASAIDALCAAPSEAALTQARQTFRASALAFAEVEMFRFGPAREDNRFERLFFWPDRRGRGFRQVATAVQTRDPTVLTPSTLRAKSVATQGLPALDYVLFGKGAEELAQAPAGHRCGYAAAIGARIASVATALDQDWSGTYVDLIGAPGPDNAVYRNSGEALGALLQAAAEQLQITSAYKISRPLGDDENQPRPKSAPLAQSGLGLEMAAHNIRAVEKLNRALDIQQALEEPEAALQLELAFFLDGARLAVAFAIEEAGDWPELLQNAETKARIAYAPVALRDAIDILTAQLPAALGLISGFNALDGD